ncbi:hypothetical protein [Flagellimonas olearia]|uniref:hypothetical protein n=1 Tax=Flagellimonas olearia TaxID=552546 RepID=UPI001478690F|nr:hypothetical protein [Allomuricauda olearia]
MENESAPLLGSHSGNPILFGLGRSVPHKMIPSSSKRIPRAEPTQIFRGISLKRR